MILQEYLIHMKNGDILHIWDDISKPFRYTFEYQLLNEHGSFLKGGGRTEAKALFIPRQNIEYISSGERICPDSQGSLEIKASLG